MSFSISEQEIEELTIQKLEALGYKHRRGADLSRRHSETFLRDSLEQALARLNPSLPANARQDALKKLLNLYEPHRSLLDLNETFHTWLTGGIPIEYQHQGQTRGEQCWLVDFSHPETNSFEVISQLTVTHQNLVRRPDLVLYVNGLPLVVIELKNPADATATLQKAYHQLQSAKQEIPALLCANEILIASDGQEARYGSLSAGWSRFMAWKTADGLSEADPFLPELMTLIQGLLKPALLLDLIRYFVIFEKTTTQDAHGLTHTQTIKKLAAYHQYYAVNKAIESTLAATAEAGNRKAGVIWHTQGSGKSLSMVFYSGKLIPLLDNPTLLILTDRNDLDDQLFGTFSSAAGLLRQQPVQAESRGHLQALLQRPSGGILFTTVQKFFPEDGQLEFPLLSERRNIVVIADEAHRSQYGFWARTIVEKDAEGNEVGARTGYGFAKYLRDALPHASFLGFTGTPVEKTDANTRQVFGDYIDIYDIARAISDGATVPIYYESRLVELALREEDRQTLDEEVSELAIDALSQDLLESSKAKWSRLEAIIGHPERLRQIAFDIVNHFESRQEAFAGKAMIVAMSRRIAAQLHDEIVALRPAWADPDLAKGQIKVVMTGTSTDEAQLRRHHTSKEERKRLAERLKDPADELKLVIVRDMWLTGFDAPCLNTLYIDKPMQGHNLMQAIARVNRVYKDKAGGLIVDYIGIASDLRDALSVYTQSGGHGAAAESFDEAVSVMLEKLDIVRGLFHAYDYAPFLSAGLEAKLRILNEAANHIEGLEQGADRLIRHVTQLAQAHALTMPREEAVAIREEVGFFQALKARMVKLEPASTRSVQDVESAIKQLVDKALVSEGVVDIFLAAGLERPDVSLLSPEFMDQLREHKYPNLAAKLLEKILKDEVRERGQKNKVQARKLSEMLDATLLRYRNKHLTTAEVIEELIKLAQDIQAGDARSEKLGLSEDELAFYDALAENESAVEVMGDTQLGELARDLVRKVRESTTLDWQVQASARAKIKVMVKRTLKQFGYPPDQAEQAIQNVLEQTELLCDNETRDAFAAGFQAASKIIHANFQRPQSLVADDAAGYQFNPTPDFLPQWIPMLPFPLASILWQSHRSSQAKDQLEHLLHFFEATAQFLATILLSGPMHHPDWFRPYVNQWLAGRQAGSRQNLHRSEFGLWTNLGQRIAKSLRQQLHSATETAELLPIYALPTELPLKILSHKEVWEILDETRVCRNEWDGHGGLAGESICAERVALLHTKLTILAGHLGALFSTWQLIVPGAGDYAEQVYRYQVDLLTGAHNEPLNRQIEVTHPLERERAYFWHLESMEALPLIPFVKLISTHQRYQCFFFNKLTREGMRWISFHDASTPEIMLEDLALQDMLKALTP